MKYLLDVNALLAWQHGRSPHHVAFHNWAAGVKPSLLTTCALSELGFLRISMQIFGYSLAQATEALTEIKSQVGGFVTELPSPRLADWATTGGRTTDAYLMQIARAHGLELATFDRGIPGSVVIG